MGQKYKLGWKKKPRTDHICILLLYYTWNHILITELHSASNWLGVLWKKGIHLTGIL